MFSGVLDEGYNTQTQISGDGYYQSWSWRFSSKAEMRAKWVPVLDNATGAKLGLTSSKVGKRSIMKDRLLDDIEGCQEDELLRSIMKYQYHGNYTDLWAMVMRHALPCERGIAVSDPSRSPWYPVACYPINIRSVLPQMSLAPQITLENRLTLTTSYNGILERWCHFFCPLPPLSLRLHFLLRGVTDGGADDDLFHRWFAMFSSLFA